MARCACSRCRGAAPAWGLEADLFVKYSPMGRMRRVGKLTLPEVSSALQVVKHFIA